MFQRRWVGEFVTGLRRVRVCHTHSCVHGTHVYTVMSHATRMYESRHIYVWVMSHTLTAPMYTDGCRLIKNELLMSPFINETCHTHVWVLINETCHTHVWVASYPYVRVMIHVRKSRITHIHESCHTHSEVMPRTYASHVTYTRDLW